MWSVRGDFYSFGKILGDNFGDLILGANFGELTGDLYGDLLK